MSWSFHSHTAYFGGDGGLFFFAKYCIRGNSRGSSVVGFRRFRETLSEVVRQSHLCLYYHVRLVECFVYSLMESQFCMGQGHFLTAFAKFILLGICLRSVCLACAFDMRSLVLVFIISVLNLNTPQFHHYRDDILIRCLCSSDFYILCCCISYKLLQFYGMCFRIQGIFCSLLVFRSIHILEFLLACQVCLGTWVVLFFEGDQKRSRCRVFGFIPGCFLYV